MRKFFIFWMLIFGVHVVEAKGAKPVSISYENLLRCFPELQDQKLSFKVDLNRLKELVDEKFVTIQSQLRQRKLLYVDIEAKTMRLTQRNKFRGGKKIESLLILEKVDEKGVYINIKLPENQRINPTQEVINDLLLNTNIKSDEYFYFDTKLNGMTAVYRLNFKEVQEYELVDGPKKRSILCEKKPELGIICTCTKK